jgi:hypothetical protein
MRTLRWQVLGEPSEGEAANTTQEHSRHSVQVLLSRKQQTTQQVRPYTSPQVLASTDITFFGQET